MPSCPWSLACGRLTSAPSATRETLDPLFHVKHPSDARLGISMSKKAATCFTWNILVHPEQRPTWASRCFTWNQASPRTESQTAALNWQLTLGYSPSHIPFIASCSAGKWKQGGPSRLYYRLGRLLRAPRVGPSAVHLLSTNLLADGRAQPQRALSFISSGTIRLSAGLLPFTSKFLVCVYGHCEPCQLQHLLVSRETCPRIRINLRGSVAGDQACMGPGGGWMPHFESPSATRWPNNREYPSGRSEHAAWQGRFPASGRMTDPVHHVAAVHTQASRCVPPQLAKEAEQIRIRPAWSVAFRLEANLRKEPRADPRAHSHLPNGAWFDD